jgi:hypothetical protein
MLLLIPLDINYVSTPFLINPFFKISSFSCRIFDYTGRCLASIFYQVPKELIVWDTIGKVNKKSLNAPKFTHW